MLRLIGLGGIDLLGISLDTVAAVALVAAGLYVLPSLRFVGAGLIALGVAVGAVAYGEGEGAAKCVSAARLDAALSQRDAARAAADAWRRTADANRKTADRMQIEKEKTDAQLAAWRSARAATLAPAVRDARAITGDDARRLCRLVEGRAAGCAGR